jgi:hypothetical protein
MASLPTPRAGRPSLGPCPPALVRLSQTYPTPEAYVAFWRAHPALPPFPALRVSTIPDTNHYSILMAPRAAAAIAAHLSAGGY